MKCPHCSFEFKALMVNADTLPDLSALICESCAGISIFARADMPALRIPSPAELRSIQASPAWRDVLGPVRDLIRDSKAPPPDRSAVSLSTGAPVTPDYREIQPDGMQKGYLVLSDDERAKGFVRPYRETYTHKTCGTDTSMGRRIAETYARDPKFYGATYCCACRTHFPLVEFVWKDTDEQVGS